MNWTLRLNELTLEHTNGYYIDLDRCQNAEQMLDWILQVAGKTWCDAESLAELVRKLGLYLGGQDELCRGAIQRVIGNPDAHRNAIRHRLVFDEMIELITAEMDGPEP